MAKKKEEPENKKPKVHPELEGLELTVNSFGEITANYDIDKINEFLNQKVDDKKLRNRKDLKPKKKKGAE